MNGCPPRVTCEDESVGSFRLCGHDRAFDLRDVRRARQGDFVHLRKMLVVLGEALFTENVVAEIPKYAPLFVKVCPLVAVCQSFLLTVVTRRWSPRRSTTR